MVIGGWAFNGSFESTMTEITPTKAGALEQQPDGTLQEATAKVLGDPTTNGVGGVLVADFNRDGRDDLLLPAHNESPFYAKASVAWISQGDGLRKITLPDSVMAHHTSLYIKDGEVRAIARSFGGSGNQGKGAGYNNIYRWNGSNFTVTNIGDLGGMAVVAGAFTAGGDWMVVAGDSADGLGRQYAPSNPMLTVGFRFTNENPTLPSISLPKPYFNDKPEYAGYASNWDPYSKTHTPRLLATDVNYDGLLDLVGLSTIWKQGPGHQRGAIQLMLNRGNFVFADDTDALAPEFSHASLIDYSTRLADVDGSGIDTWFVASPTVLNAADDEQRHGQYVLVNDGAGHLYAAMHDEFRAMRTQVTAFASSRLPGSGIGSNFTPTFIAYRTPNGLLNFVAAIRATVDGRSARAFVNVPLQINLTTDFRRDLVVALRNNSRRIRTFAGNDTIHRAQGDPDCTIDGGLGTNVAVYPGPRANWTISRDGDRTTIKPAQGVGGIDTLIRIQTARFADGDVSLTQ